MKNELDKIYLFLLVTISVFIAFGCNKKSSIIWIKHSNRLQVDSIDGNGHILKSAYFLLDSTTLDGSTITFNNEGIIEKWLWYNSAFSKGKNGYPYAGIYYNKRGIFEEFVGSPILSIDYYRDGSLLIRLIQPPKDKNIYLAGIKDSLGGKLIFKEALYPNRTDTSSLVLFKKLEINNEHNLWFYYYIMDSNETLQFTYKTRINLSEYRNVIDNSLSEPHGIFGRSISNSDRILE